MISDDSLYFILIIVLCLCLLYLLFCRPLYVLYPSMNCLSIKHRIYLIKRKQIVWYIVTRLAISTYILGHSPLSVS